MHYGVKFEDFGNRWREAMKEYDGGYSRRTTDDTAEKQFWANFFEEKKVYNPDAYSLPIGKETEKIISPYMPCSILEIGPGWGNYTFLLEKLSTDMACTDISEAVLHFISAKASKTNVKIKTIPVKWEDYRENCYDIVFGFNCFYRMREIEVCLEKINDTANKLCIIGMTSGPEQEYFREMEEVLGLEIKYHKLDYIYLINILYQLEIDCNVKIVPLENDYLFDSFEAACQNAASRILTPDYDKAEFEQILSKYIKKNDKGEYHYLHKYTGALLYWEPIKKKNNIY